MPWQQAGIKQQLFSAEHLRLLARTLNGGWQSTANTIRRAEPQTRWIDKRPGPNRIKMSFLFQMGLGHKLFNQYPNK